MHVAPSACEIMQEQLARIHGLVHDQARPLQETYSEALRNLQSIQTEIHTGHGQQDPFPLREEEQDQINHIKHCWDIATIFHLLLATSGTRIDLLHWQLQRDRLQADTALKAYQNVPESAHQVLKATFSEAAHAIAVELLEVVEQFESGVLSRDFEASLDRQLELQTGRPTPPEQSRRSFQNIGLRGYTAQRISRSFRPPRYSPYDETS